MNKKLIAISFLFFFSLLPNQSYSQQLASGSAQITVASIILTYYPDGRILYLEGSPPYLIVKWISRYSDGSDRFIGVKCFLNCPYDPTSTEFLETVCAGYKNCSYIGPTGERFCIINANLEDFNLRVNEINNVTCRFYDPDLQSIDFRPYPNESFKPLYYKLSLPSSLDLRVGESTRIPIGISYEGIFRSSINFTFGSNNPSAIGILTERAESPELYYRETGTVYGEILVKNYLENINLIVNSTFSDYKLSCTDNSDCFEYFGSHGICDENGRCWKEDVIPIKIEMVSLAEMGNLEPVLILLGSLLLLLLAKRK